jgi:hypothetical protein
MSLRRLGSLLLVAALPLAGQAPVQAAKPNPNRPTLFLVGDLPSASGQDAFDLDLIKLVDSPANGQTTRTYINSGAWDQLAAQIKPGDFVLIGFKPGTDASPAKLGTDARAAATLTFQSAGDSTFDYMDPDTHALEHIHSYAWYLRKFVVDAINHGANPMLCYPPTPADPANRFPNNPYLAHPAWIIKAIATEQRIPFVDLASGAPLRAGLEALHDDPLAPYLMKAGK